MPSASRCCLLLLNKSIKLPQPTYKAGTFMMATLLHLLWIYLQSKNL